MQVSMIMMQDHEDMVSLPNLSVQQNIEYQLIEVACWSQCILWSESTCVGGIKDIHVQVKIFFSPKVFGFRSCN